MSNRFLMGMPPNGVSSRLFKVVNGPPLIAALGKMHSQFAGYLSCPLTISCFFALANTAMEVYSSNCCHSFVHDILVQRVDEAVAPCDRAVWPLLNPRGPDEL